LTELDGVLRYVADCTLVEMRHLLVAEQDRVGTMNRWTGRYERTGASSRSDDVGLLAGRLWLLYLATGDAELLDLATRVVGSIATAVAGELEEIQMHLDLYFGLCWGAEVSGSQAWADLACAASRSLVRTCWSPRARAFVLELPDERLIVMESAAFTFSLAWAGRMDRELLRVFTGHLDRLLDLGFVRSDGSCYQIAELDRAQEVVRMASYQGYATESTWARGQAWGMLSYTTGYETTGEARFLDTATRMANWWVARTAVDPVPFYDFDDPRRGDLPRDSCAAAMAAGVLVRLDRLVRGAGYLEAADRTIAELCANYLGRGGGLLHGSAGNIRTPTLFGRAHSRRAPRSAAEWPSSFRFPQEEVMPYGDFFFVDALYRRSHEDWRVFALPSNTHGHA
jgi:unsaturated chondroitin disaccharide hydrolase